MNNNATLFFSHKLEILANQLGQQLFQKTQNPLLSRFVIVPSQFYKDWLFEYWTRQNSQQILAGARYLRIDEAILFFRKKSKNHVLAFPSKLKLQILIEEVLQKVSGESDSSLSDYVGSTDMRQHRIDVLSKQLSELFSLYAIYSPQKMQINSQSDPWQEKVWNEIFFNQKNILPYKALLEDLTFPATFQAEIHCFGFDFMPPVYFEFFSRLSGKMPVYHYVFSPSKFYWEDVCSDRERASIKKYHQKKQANLTAVQQLDSYLRDRNPLLANWGKYGQQYVRTVGAYDITSQEFYDDLDESSLFLKKVQQDLLNMKNPDEKEPDKTPSDDSIQIHAAPSSKLREVEILHENLIFWAQSQSVKPSKNKMDPAEILVMAPNIQDYAAYIHFVFGDDESPFDYKISGLQLSSQSFLAQGVLSFFSLVGGKWEVDQVLDLFQNPSFQKKVGLRFEEAQLFVDWVEQTKVQWGQNLDHQKQFIESDHLNDRSTWDYGFEQILMGLIYTVKDPLGVTFPYPVSGVEISHAEIIEKILQIFTSLRSDTQELERNSLKKPSDWAKLLETILKRYFWVEDQSSEKSCESILLGGIRKLRELSKSISKLVRFDVIYDYIRGELSQSNASFHASSLGAVRFCSFSNETIVPSEGIYLLGMEEESFFDPLSSYNLIYKNRHKNYFPISQEKKRYACLKALFSARSFFWISYRHLSPQDGKMLLPSLFVQELLSYLDRSYRIEDKKPSVCIRKEHPSLPFHKDYFAEDPVLHNFSEKHFKAASIFYDQGQKISLNKVEFLLPSTRSPVETKTIHLRQLSALSRHPIKFFCQHSIGVYLDPQLYESSEVSEFQLTHLDRYLFRKEFFNNSVDTVISQGLKQNRLPLGVFQTIAEEQIRSDRKKIDQAFAHFGLRQGDFFNISLESECSVAEQKGRNWILPPLELQIDQTRIKIIGKIPNVSLEGLVCLTENRLGQQIHIWPEYLVYLHCAKQVGAKPTALFLKNGKRRDDPSLDFSGNLTKYIRYYFLALKNLSPLIPEWSEALLKGTSSDLKTVIANALKGSSFGFEDLYLKWVFSTAKPVDIEKIHESWGKYFQDIFCDLISEKERS